MKLAGLAWIVPTAGWFLHGAASVWRARRAPTPSPPAGSRPTKERPMNFSLSAMFDDLESVTAAILAGAAQSSTPLSAIDPAHPIATAALDAGKVLGSAFPQATPIAAFALQMAQTWVAMNAPPAPATAPH